MNLPCPFIFPSINSSICHSVHPHQINFHRSFFKNCKGYKVETWYIHTQWVDLLCLLESGAKAHKSLSYNSWYESCKVETWYTHGHLADVLPESGPRIYNFWELHPLIAFTICQLWKIFAALFPRTVRVTKLHYENMPIQIYRNFHVQKLKIFR